MGLCIQRWHCEWAKAKTIYGSCLKVMLAQRIYCYDSHSPALCRALVLTNYQQIHNTVSVVCGVASKKSVSSIYTEAHTQRERVSTYFVRCTIMMLICLLLWFAETKAYNFRALFVFVQFTLHPLCPLASIIV